MPHNTEFVASLMEQIDKLRQENARLRKLPERLGAIDTLCKRTKTGFKISYHTPPGGWMAKTWGASIMFNGEYETPIVERTLAELITTIAKKFEADDE